MITVNAVFRVYKLVICFISADLSARIDKIEGNNSEIVRSDELAEHRRFAQ